MYFKNLLTLLTILACFHVQAQQQNHSCGFHHWIQHIGAENPDQARDLRDQYESWIEQSRAQQRDDEVYQVPVVFHIVYNNENQNLADSVVYSQLEVLNEDYRRLNANAIETREEFLPVAADVGIEFVLADTDPEGNPANGIVRTYTDRENFELNLFATDNSLDEVKSSATGGSDAWDTDHYLNIWVCNISAGMLGQVFGLAYPPVGVPNWPDGASAPESGKEGVIIHYTTLGRNNPHHADDGVAENNQGRTLVHEIGHYFGLRHIWGDAIVFLGEDGCEADDGFADTPNCAESDNFACSHTANSCVDSPMDFVNMIENYMDYSQDACMNMFTQEQADMMRFALTELRPGLLGSTSSAHNMEGSNFSVYPNPASDQVVVRSDKNIARVVVLDQTGRQVLQKDNLNNNVANLSLQNLAAGSYILRIESGNETAVETLIKQ